MKRRRRLKKIFILPPVLLAAILIWLVAGQAASIAASGRNVLLGGGVREPAGSDEGGTDASEDTAEGQPGAGVLHIRSDCADGPASDRTEDSFGHSDSITLLFAGDIYLSNHVLNAYEKAGGISGVLDEELRAVIGGADIFMANEEFPFSDRGGAAENKEFTFRLPPDKISILEEIGPDIVALANNHTLDFGRTALLDTLDTLRQAGILQVGAGENLDEAKALQVIGVQGKQIGFLAASRVIPESGWAAGKSRPGMLTTYDPGILLKEIEAAKSVCDYVVVYVHWGIERNTEPEQYQRALGRQYIDAGADLVVGSHPHVLQGIEYYKGKPIVYSLGNFIFGSSIPRTALLKVELFAEHDTAAPGEEDGTVDAAAQGSGTAEGAGELRAALSLIPGTSSAGYTRSLGEGGSPEFFQYMTGLSFDISIDSAGNVIPLDQNQH